MDPGVEQYFESTVSTKLDVDFMSLAEWFLGTCFVWSTDTDGHFSCHLSQEVYANEVVDVMGLSLVLVSPLMTPFPLGLLVDRIHEKQLFHIFVEVSQSKMANFVKQGVQ